MLSGPGYFAARRLTRHCFDAYIFIRIGPSTSIRISNRFDVDGPAFLHE